MARAVNIAESQRQVALIPVVKLERYAPGDGGIFSCLITGRLTGIQPQLVQPSVTFRSEDGMTHFDTHPYHPVYCFSATSTFCRH